MFFNFKKSDDLNLSVSKEVVTGSTFKKVENLYCMFDKVAGSVLYYFNCVNDGLAIRSQVPSLSKTVPIGDVVLYKVGTVDLSTMQVESCPPVAISWDIYKQPVNPFDKVSDKK